MKTSSQPPPNAAEIIAAFGVEFGTGVVATYGDTCYGVTHPMSEDLTEHEMTHTRQQNDAGGPEAWWSRYIAEPEFRLAQELEAYQVQVRIILRTYHDRNAAARAVMTIAKDLSGPMYGNCISYAEAIKQIRP